MQWYFDNLLPEEQLRSILAKEAQIDEADAFGLLVYFGADSLSLAAPDAATAPMGLIALPLPELDARIRNLPRATLTHDSPKRMSLAGAQHKMVVVYRDGQLFEPLPGTASTHILKPDSQSSRLPPLRYQRILQHAAGRSGGFERARRTPPVYARACVHC